jgi:hypothetical protein
MMSKDCTAERVREMFHYDPETGVFTRRVSVANVKAGTPAGRLNKNDGYIQLMLDYKKYRAHRLIWLYVYGEWPTHTIDHINGDRSDNRIANLRDVDCATNNQNKHRPGTRNTSGFLGATFCNTKGKWRAQITVGRRLKFLGHHATPELAHEAYVAAKRILHQGNTL